MIFHPSFFARAKCHTLFGPFLNKSNRGTELRPEYSILKTRAQGNVYKSPSGGLIVLHPPSKQGEFSKCEESRRAPPSSLRRLLPNSKASAERTAGSFSTGLRETRQTRRSRARSVCGAKTTLRNGTRRNLVRQLENIGCGQRNDRRQKKQKAVP